MSSPAVAPMPSDHHSSEARRKALNVEVTGRLPLVSNFFAIDKYYDAADKVYFHFEEKVKDLPAIEASLADLAKKGVEDDDLEREYHQYLNDAYVFGKRYCAFCMDAIPTHDYFKQPKFRSLRELHTRRVQRVLESLERDVVVRMDRQEVAAKEKWARRQKEEEQKQLVELQKRAARQLQQSTTQRIRTTAQSQTNGSLQTSAENKLNLLMPPAPQDSGTTTRVRPSPDPSGKQPGKPGPRYQFNNLDDDSDNEGGEKSVSLPPPVLPPDSSGPGHAASQPMPVAAGAAPPPYHQVVSTQRNAHYHRNLWDPMQPELQHSQQPTLDLKPQQPQPEKDDHWRRLPMKQLQEMYRKEYVQHQQTGKIQVRGLDTYQGRVHSSTNGCTVISALVAARHLEVCRARESSISDSDVCRVIDSSCGPILQKIRGKLGLGGQALIIPSDVHDHLVDEKILHQDDFVGAAGGNVMDPDHMGEFLKLLSGQENGKTNGGEAPYPAAATFFFREHVISIVKTAARGGTGTSYYDLVDSLPGMPLSGGRYKATRTQCKDLASLRVLLRWYTSRKFSDNNCIVIDRNDWDDSQADFDPRVFQGFVWAVKD